MGEPLVRCAQSASILSFARVPSRASGFWEETMKLGKLGVWTSLDGVTAARSLEIAKSVEARGYAALWMPESRGGKRPRMLALSAEHADGAHPYNVPPEHTHEARRILGPGKLLCPEQMVVLEKDSATARGIARGMLAMYL